ncbi:MAG: hypothetical protein IPK97_08510 [Ahniella sp.]|nr:hypothetical protein [Ahniella sp.]
MYGLDASEAGSFTIFPCRNFDESSQQHLVSTQIKDSGVSRKLVLWTISWDRRGQPSLDNRAVTVLSYRWPPEGEQPDASAIDSGDVRLGDAVCRSGLVHACFTSAQSGRAAVQWVQIDTASGKVRQQGVLGDEALSLAYPSLQPNQEDPQAVLHGGRARLAAVHCSGRTAGRIRTAASAPSDWPPPARASRQEKDQRWGDYTGMAADPANPEAAWAAPLNRSGTLLGNPRHPRLMHARCSGTGRSTATLEPRQNACPVGITSIVMPMLELPTNPME